MKTWREFTKGKMGPYMKSEGSHAAAMKRLSKEWKDYQKSQSKSSKTYTKSHRLDKAAISHKKKIRDRGGNIIKSKRTKGKTVLKYSFPSN